MAAADGGGDIDDCSGGDGLMMYRGKVLNGVEARALVDDLEAEIARLRAYAAELSRELIFLRPPQEDMVMAALQGAGWGELWTETQRLPTVEQYQMAAEELRSNLREHRGGSWFDMCARLRARLGLPPRVEEKPKRRKAA